MHITPVGTMIHILPVLLLLMLFLLPRNRNRHVLWVLASCLVSGFIIYAFYSITADPANGIKSIAIGFLFYMYGLCAAWLLSGKDRIKARAVNLLFTMAKLYVSSGIAVFAFWGFSMNFFLYLVAEGIVAGSMFVALLLTGACNSKACIARRVIYWLAFWIIILSLFLGIFFGTMEARSPSEESDIFLKVLASYTLMGVVLYIQTFPFIALALWEPHFKQRFSSVYPFPPEPEDTPLEVEPPAPTVNR